MKNTCTLWDVKEVKEEVAQKVNMVKVETREQLENLSSIMSKVPFENIEGYTRINTTEVLKQIFNNPIIIDGHNNKNKFDLRDGHLIYILNSGQVGLGIMGKSHCINAVHCSDGKNILSPCSISGTILCSGVKDIDIMEERINQTNEDIMFEGLRVHTAFYFV